MPDFDYSESEIHVMETIQTHKDVLEAEEDREFSLGSAAAATLSGNAFKFSSDEEREKAVEKLARMASKVSGIPYDEA